MTQEATGGVLQANAPAQIGFAGASGSGALFGGSAGRRLIEGGFNVNVLRPCRDDGNGNVLNVNATLMRDEWRQFDNTVQTVARERLVVTQRLLAAGLQYNLPNALGTMSLEWEQELGDLVEAEITMSGLNEATKDRTEFTTVSMPIPIIHKEFFYNLRHLEAARRNGRNVETTHAEMATRKVAERVEALIFNGLTIAGGNIYGLLTHPQRKTLTVTAAWAGATGPQIVGDIRRMMDTAALPPNLMEGPYILFMPRTLQSKMDDDYRTDVANTDSIITRIRGLAGIQDVIFTNRLTGTQAVLVQVSNDVIQMINGLNPTLVEWDSHGGFQHNFKIFAIMLPRVRANGEGQSGIVHIS
jgi:uncharacterized linocin/CFP29 family protein